MIVVRGRSYGPLLDAERRPMPAWWASLHRYPAISGFLKRTFKHGDTEAQRRKTGKNWKSVSHEPLRIAFSPLDSREMDGSILLHPAIPGKARTLRGRCVSDFFEAWFQRSHGMGSRTYGHAVDLVDCNEILRSRESWAKVFGSIAPTALADARAMPAKILYTPAAKRSRFSRNCRMNLNFYPVFLRASVLEFFHRGSTALSSISAFVIHLRKCTACGRQRGYRYVARAAAIVGCVLWKGR